MFALPKHMMGGIGMTKKRIALYMAVLMVFILMMSLTSAIAAPSLSLYATLEGESHQYTGVVGTYATLEITINNNPAFYGTVSREIVLDLPDAVSIQSVSSGRLNGNRITGWSGSTISVELYLKSVSYKYSSGQYRADPIRMTYHYTDGLAKSYYTSCSLFVGVNRAGESASFVTNLAAAYPYNTYVDSYPSYRQNYSYYPAYLPISQPGYYPGYLFDWGHDGWGYDGWGYGGWDYVGGDRDYYEWFKQFASPSGWDFYYDDDGFWMDGKHLPYGSYYNGFTYYGRNPYGYYNPYSTVNNYYGLTLNASSMSLGRGQSQQLTVNVGAFGSAYGLNWSSSNASVAAVDSNGLVTGLSNGTATITVRATYGTTATCVVTVGSGGVSTTSGRLVPTAPNGDDTVRSLSFSASRTPDTLRVGEEAQLYIVIEPKGTNYGSTQVVSSDPSVLQVLEGGVVVGVSPGQAAITFSFGGKTAVHTITVR